MNDIKAVGDAAQRVAEVVDRGQVDSSSQTSTNNSTPPAEAKPAGDSVALTGTASKLQALENELNTVPVVDQQRVEAVSQAISEGRFEVDAERTAERLVDFELLRSNNGTNGNATTE